jgi:seryl-tRNA synthetase
MPENWIELTPAVKIPDFMVGEVQSKLAYVDEAILQAVVPGPGDHIRLRLSSDLQGPERLRLEEKVQRVVTTLSQGARPPKVQVLEDHLDRPTSYRQDPMVELLGRGEVVQEGEGIFTLGPLLSRLINYLERRFLNLANSFDADPYRFPTLISARFLDRVGYFRAFPHSLSFATHLRGDLDVIDDFAQHAACDDHGLNAPPESFARIQALLSPAVCYHFYYTLTDKPLPGGKMTATAVGNCFRHESSNLTTLERLWNFTMREIIFVGPQEFVLHNRETARQRMADTLAELGLAYRVESANDPFFIGEFRRQAAFQSAFQLKFEIRARLPFRDGTLAVGSYNYHQDFFGRHLNISLPDGTPAHTGCVAFGLERMAFALLAQHGLDPAGWPPALQEALK